MQYNKLKQTADNDIRTNQIGLVRNECKKNNVYNINTIASAYQQIKDEQLNDKRWCYGNYSESGSDASGVIVNGATGEKQNCIIWSINHYLGFNRHPQVIESAKKALDIYGTGCGTSAMSGGHSHLHKVLEDKLAKILGKESALLFTSGYSANIGAISGLARGSDNLVLVDKDVHASVIDGCKLAGCKYLPFKHNSTSDLETKLKKYTGKYKNIFVIVESVYSMTGNHAPLAEIAELRKKYNFLYFVDEAHAFGLYGKDGGGRCKALGISSDVDFIMTTLSKSTGSIGGVIATSKEFATLLQVEATAYMFQAAITPPDAASIITALELIEREDHVVKGLWIKTKYFRAKLKNLGFDIGEGFSPIIPVYIRDSQKLLDMGKDLFAEGIFTTSVTFPAVHHKEVRFRFIVNASHTMEQINRTIETLVSIGRKYGIVE